MRVVLTIYPCRDYGQFSDATRLFFSTSPLFMDIPILCCGSIFWCMSTDFSTTSLFMDTPISWCGSIFWCKSTVFFLRHNSQVTFWYESAFNEKPTCCVLISNQRQIFLNRVSHEWLGNRIIVRTLCRKNFMSLDEKSTVIFPDRNCLESFILITTEFHPLDPKWSGAMHVQGKLYWFA